MESQETDILIIGAGFSGLGVAAQLTKKTRYSFKIIERNPSLGGTWYENTYPGCRCDVESVLYSFSFFQKTDWQSTFAKHDEINQYLKDLATYFGLDKHITYNQTIDSARWDEEIQRWIVSTQGNQYVSKFLVNCSGPLSQPKYPDLAGMSEFTGPLIHTALWDPSVSLKNKTVGVIGTGASAIQVIPEIQKEVKDLYVFQRTAPWLLLKTPEEKNTKRRARFKKYPMLQKMYRVRRYLQKELVVSLFLNPKLIFLAEKMSTKQLAQSIPDEELRKKLTPSYRIGCKRILQSDNYYEALQKDNVHLIDKGVTTITSTGVICSDDSKHPLDVIICATGFTIMDYPLMHATQGALGKTLYEEVMESGAYYGGFIKGFPNYFTMLGPNTGLGHTSMTVMMESQFNLLIDSITQLFRSQRRKMTVKETALTKLNKKITRRIKKTVWASGCDSWYISPDGTNRSIWPSSTIRFRFETKKLRSSDFDWA